MEDDDEINLHESCPNCGTDYDEIDYEYQICHWCGYNAESEATGNQQPETGN